MDIITASKEIFTLGYQENGILLTILAIAEVILYILLFVFLSKKILGSFWQNYKNCGIIEGAFYLLKQFPRFFLYLLFICVFIGFIGLTGKPLEIFLHPYMSTRG